MKPKVGRNFTSERGEGVKGEVKNISLHWLQGIFETVPYMTIDHFICDVKRRLLGKALSGVVMFVALLNFTVVVVVVVTMVAM